MDPTHLMEQEYRHFLDHRICKNADKFKEKFPDNEVEKCYPPCFYAGNLNTAKIAILGLNPGYKEEVNDKELKIFNGNKEEGNPFSPWEKTYTNFFDYFKTSKKNTGLQLKTPYYSRLAILIAGIAGRAEKADNDQRYDLLNSYVVNLDLLPYHSPKIRLDNINETQREFLEPYLNNLKEIIRPNIQLILLNGKIWKNLGWEKTRAKPIQSIEKKRKNGSRRLTFEAHEGILFDIPAIYFTQFITGKTGLTNKELHQTGEKIDEILRNKIR